MALKIRLRQQGRKNRQAYRLVVIDSRNPRDGRYIESLGWYNPLEEGMNFNEERIQYWLDTGAILSERASQLIKKQAPNILTALREKERLKKIKLASERRSKKTA